MYSIFNLLPFLNTGVIPSVISLLTYLGLSLGIFMIAKKCGLKNAALAWIPFVRFFVLGKLADDYLATSKGKATKYRILFPILAGVALVAYQLVYLAQWIVFALYFGGLFSAYVLFILGAAFEAPVFLGLGYVIMLGSIMIFVSVMSVVSAVSSTAALVYHAIRVWVLHPVYKMCDRENATLYTVLSILFTFAPAIALPYAAKKLMPEPEEVFDILEAPAVTE